MNVLIDAENDDKAFKKKKEFVEKLQYVDWKSKQKRLDAGLVLSFAKHGEFGMLKEGNMSATFEEVDEEFFDESL